MAVDVVIIIIDTRVVVVVADLLVAKLAVHLLLAEVLRRHHLVVLHQPHQISHLHHLLLQRLTSLHHNLRNNPCSASISATM